MNKAASSIPTKKRLNKKNISELPELPKGRDRYDVTDTKTTGLVLRVYKKRKVFEFRYRFGGKSKRYTIGDFGPWTPELAEKKAEALAVMVNDGKDPLALKQAIKAIPTFKTLCEEYLATAQKRSLKDDKAKIAQVFIPKWGSKQVTTITSNDIRALLKKLHTKGPSGKPLSPATVNRYLALIKVIFSRAIEWEMIEKNPASPVKPLEENNEIERILTTDEFARLFDAMSQFPPNGMNCLRLAMFTGTRIGNCMEAKWDEFDLDNAIWLIPTTKSGKRHRVYLSSLALELIRDQKRIFGGTPYVFPNKDKNGPIVSLQQQWAKLLQLAEISNLRIHDLRHNYASLMINNGRSLFDVQKALGHSDPSVTQRYAHLFEERQRHSAEQVANGMVVSLAAHKAKKSA